MRYEFRPLVQWTDPETDPRQSSSVFRASWSDTLGLLADELRHLEAAEPVVLQVGVTEGDIRMDGMLRANAKVNHPGVAISFRSKFGPLRYATDAYERQWSGAMPGWQANVRAIALALKALRAVDRYGVSKRGEQYTGWRAITSAGPRFPSPADAEQWMRKADDLEGQELALGALYRKLARRLHPDTATGSPDAWEVLDEARRVLAEAGWL